MFQFAINLSSGLFLLLYGVTVTVHVVEYIWGKVGGTPANGGVTRYLPWTLAACGVIAAAVAVTLPNFGRDAILGGTRNGSGRDTRPLPAAAPLRLSAELGADASLTIAPSSPGDADRRLSPDGTQLAFVAQPHGGGAPRLYVRRLDQLTAAPLAGTEGAAGPFFSPDGQWLGFFGGGKLKKIAITGGAGTGDRGPGIGDWGSGIG